MRKSVRWTLLAAAIFPPTVAFATWHQLIGSRPVGATLLLLGYEAAVGIIAFAADILHTLRTRWNERLSDQLDEWARRRLTKFERRYHEFLQATLRYIDLKGLSTIGFYTPELDEVFVEVSLAYRPPHEVPTGIFGPTVAEAAERGTLPDFLDKDNGALLALIGGPGSGKTTLLRHTARHISRRRGRHRRTPIVLYLRDHGPRIAGNRALTLAGLLREWLPRDLREPHGWFEQRLRAGSCVVLLDGLDEVADLSLRRLVSDWIELQVRLYPRNDFVITSRPQGYREASIDGATVLQVRSFTDAQVTAFVHGWYAAVERHATDTSWEARVRAEAAARDLLDRLSRTPELLDLTVNPLLLTMIANVHRYRGALPGSRARLYGEICEVMLWRRQEEKRLTTELGGDVKEAVLRGLAYVMMRTRVRDMPRPALIEQIREGLARHTSTPAIDAFLHDVSSNGLLVEREADVYSFAHHTFQEYLAASHIRDSGLGEVLTGTVDDTWWRETTLLYASRSDSDSIVDACLASGSINALALAFDCADQLGPMASRLRTAVDDLLHSAVDPDLPADRRMLMAGVIASRHLRAQVRAAAGARLCVQPVSTCVYWLHRQDTECPLPDGLAALNPAPEDIKNPVPIQGVRASDATRVVDWLNARNLTGTAYRLPQRTELADPAMQRTIAAIMPEGTWTAWVQTPGPDQNLTLWAPQILDDPHEVQLADLRASVAEDVDRAMPVIARLLLVRSTLIVESVVAALDRVQAADFALDHVLDDVFDVNRTLRHVGNVGKLDVAPLVAQGIRLDESLTDALQRTRRSNRLPEAREIARDWQSQHHQTLRADPSAGCELARLLGVGSDMPSQPEWSRDEMLDAVLGTAISAGLAYLLRQDVAADLWRPEFVRTLLAQTRPGEAPVSVSPDRLAARLPETLAETADRWRTRGGGARWAADLLHRWLPPVLDVLHRARPLDNDLATALRLATLCLWAEAESQRDRSVVAMLREAALTLTWLQLRANGSRPRTEIILLAVA